MRVLIIHNKHKFRGGEETFVDIQKKAHKKMGDKVRLYTKDNRNISKISIGLILNSLFSIRTYYELQTLIANFKPDVVFIHNVFPLMSISAYYALNRHKVPKVQLIHNYHYVKSIHNSGQTVIKRYMNLLRFITKALIFKKSKYLFAYPSEYIRKVYSNTFMQQKKFVLTPPLDVITTPTTNKDANLKKKSYNLYLGRFSEEKGIWDILNVAKRLRDESFLLVGDGEMSKKISQFISKHKLKNIKVSKYKHGKAKWNSLRNAKLILIPSKWQEPFGLTLIEALLTQTPVIATNSGGMKETIGSTSSCFTYEAGNITELENKIKFINKHYKTIFKKTQQDKEKISKQFTVENYLNQVHTSLNNK